MDLTVDCPPLSMTHYDVSFRLQHDCPYNSFSRRHPEVVISHWCNLSRDVLEISHRNVKTGTVQRSIRVLVKELGTRVLRRSYTTANLQVVLQRCACSRIPPPHGAGISAHEEKGALMSKAIFLGLEPSVYTEGWEWYDIIAFSERDLKNLFRDLEETCKVEVTSRRTISDESVRETFPVSTPALFGNLTSKQQSALITALDHGYYNIPRAATAREIARRL